MARKQKLSRVTRRELEELWNDLEPTAKVWAKRLHLGTDGARWALTHALDVYRRKRPPRGALNIAVRNRLFDLRRTSKIRAARAERVHALEEIPASPGRQEERASAGAEVRCICDRLFKDNILYDPKAARELREYIATAHALAPENLERLKRSLAPERVDRKIMRLLENGEIYVKVAARLQLTPRERKRFVRLGQAHYDHALLRASSVALHRPVSRERLGDPGALMNEVLRRCKVWPPKEVAETFSRSMGVATVAWQLKELGACTADQEQSQSLFYFAGLNVLRALVILVNRPYLLYEKMTSERLKEFEEYWRGMERARKRAFKRHRKA